MSTTAEADVSGQTQVTRRLADDFERQITREWLITNGRGGYASGTVLGLPTRRYHGLLIAAARPPLERWLLVSALLERVGSGGTHLELANFQFGNIIHPKGYEYLTDFAVSNNGQTPWARFVYQHGDTRLVKQVVMEHGKDEVTVRYSLRGRPGEPLSLELAPFLAMRDYHALTHAFVPGYAINETSDYVTVDAFRDGPRVWLTVRRCDEGLPVAFTRQPDWWYGIRYHQESARGLDDREDLFTPGWFGAVGTERIELEFRAVADFIAPPAEPPPARQPITLAESPAVPPSIEQRLREAADIFVVARRCPGHAVLTTILAGYHWFGDWGRDTFIALPGLLLETGRLTEARQVLEVFASAIQDGLVPNRFSDYGEGRDYNSVDASLWFLHGACAYLDASGDQIAWRDFLAPACLRVVDAFTAGTKFNIRVDTDGLLSCGDESTQLTWMDAKCNNVVFTPRHGKPVEINALWYHDLLALAERIESQDPERAGLCRELAERSRQAFVPTFWNEAGGYLYDVVRDGYRDPAVRPNQIFAVSLPHSPLSRYHQQAVLAIVEERLLTPYGLRSLCQRHPAYRGRYQGGPFERDSVYHQGTVWAWLIGPYVEAYLRVHDFSSEAKKKMRAHLQSLIDHLDVAGLNSVSEIFDGDPPHTPGGCIAQAWSVAELLRALHLTT